MNFSWVRNVDNHDALSLKTGGLYSPGPLVPCVAKSVLMCSSADSQKNFGHWMFSHRTELEAYDIVDTQMVSPTKSWRCFTYTYKGRLCASKFN